MQEEGTGNGVKKTLLATFLNYSIIYSQRHKSGNRRTQLKDGLAAAGKNGG